MFTAFLIVKDGKLVFEEYLRATTFPIPLRGARPSIFEESARTMGGIRLTTWPQSRKALRLRWWALPSTEVIFKTWTSKCSPTFPSTRT